MPPTSCCAPTTSSSAGCSYARPTSSSSGPAALTQQVRHPLGLPALAALNKGGPCRDDADFYTGKVAATRFFARNLPPKITGERLVAVHTDNALMDVPESAC